MKYKIYIDREREEEILIYAHEKNHLVERIEELILEQQRDILAFGDGEVVRLCEDEIFCFVVEEGRVFALTERDKFQLKMRLYQLEEQFSDRFVKINQSCLVNVDKIARFDASIGGSLKVTLKNGYKDYISRRQMRTVKDRIGF
ncbi:MAG: LytTR family transcriptional regulator DNA-binding domain-containing protein [Clostridia bacterium]|nr:LytTR family transcriptional regulator DNA-binding domain-containing protein [Clostridia bacterium]